MSIKSIVRGENKKTGRLFDILSLSSILLFVVLFSIHTLPTLSDEHKKILKNLEYILFVCFTLEYAIRIYAAKKKSDYLFSFYGIIDFSATVLFWFFLLQGLESSILPVLRALRIVMVFKLLRHYNKSIQLFRKTFLSIKDDIIVFFSMSLIFLYLSSVGIWFFEHEQNDAINSIFDGLWWAVITLTTVGYGDVYPVTAGGKIFTAIIVVMGIGIIAVPTGLLVQGLLVVKKENTQDNERN